MRIDGASYRKAAGERGRSGQGQQRMFVSSVEKGEKRR